MSMNCRSWIITISLIAIPFLVSGQGTVEWGMLPRINLSYKVGVNTKLVHSTETRHFFYEKGELGYRYALTDLSLLISHRFRPNKSLNAGALLRVEDDGIRIRLIEQLNVVKNYSQFRLGFRYAADQTFGNNDLTVFRFRYRISYEKPLSGDRVDQGEFYYKLGNEYLAAIDTKEVDLEVRGLIFLGFEISRTTKVETGLDYRLNRFISSATRNRLMWGLTYYRTLK